MSKVEIFKKDKKLNEVLATCKRVVYYHGRVIKKSGKRWVPKIIIIILYVFVINKEIYYIREFLKEVCKRREITKQWN